MIEQTETAHAAVDQRRLFDRLMRLGEIGAQPSGGVTRLALTAADEEGLTLVAAYMRQAGLSVRRDQAGNLIGRRDGRRPGAPVVLTGSHTDTVIDAGRFDGALGVIGAIEAVQAIGEAGIETEHPIEVAVYRDEEGVRFNGVGLSGARAMVGLMTPDRLRHTDRDGLSIADAVAAIGLDPDRVADAARPAESIKAHVELHIEQGKVLETHGLSVGVVTGICCASRMAVTLVGEAGHAGATPMAIRRDPLVAAAELIQAVESEASAVDTAVGTVGQIAVSPGAVNVIPGRVTLTIDIRALSDEGLARVSDAIFARGEEICERRGIALRIDVLSRGIAKHCSPEIRDTIERAVDALGLPVFRLPSGAGHDSGSFYRYCPMGMIFVRSQGGISHSPAEWSSPEDCADGANVLLRTLLDLAVIAPQEKAT